jgi:uncharacterized protein YecE (DUF72 family)
MKPGDFLGYYATQFMTVEADTTYYAVPRPELVLGWEKKTPPGFVLSAKFPRSIVHGGQEAKPDRTRVLVPDVVGRDLDAFLAAMDLLGPKCGPLVLQFPYFGRDAFRTLREFLDRLEPFLERLPTRFRYGVEVRNKAWLVPELTESLRRHNVALVLVDIAYMPHPAELELDLLTSDFTYVRLIGDRKAVEAKTERFDRIVLDQSAQLDRWSAYLSPILGRGWQIYVYANNHYAGHGPETIRELVWRLSNQGGTSPDSIPNV